MKIIIIGATGTIGRAVAGALEARHEIVGVSRNGSVRVDMEDPASISAMFTSVTSVDAVICCAASGRLAALDDPSDEDFFAGLNGKLLGQLILARRALHFLRDGGSITLTSGAFERPTPGSAFGALVNAGLEAFVQAAAIEMPRNLRLNVVSPGWVSETLTKLGFDPAGGTPVDVLARVYVEAVEGTMNGQTLRPKHPGGRAE